MRTTLMVEKQTWWSTEWIQERKYGLSYTEVGNTKGSPRGKKNMPSIYRPKEMIWKINEYFKGKECNSKIDLNNSKNVKVRY